MGATQRNLQAQPKILKKIIITSNQPIKTKNFPKKTVFSSLKVKISRKFVWRLPDGICPENIKNNKTQIKFKKPYSEKKKCLG
jgi:hypothetical protein